MQCQVGSVCLVIWKVLHMSDSNGRYCPSEKNTQTTASWYVRTKYIDILSIFTLNIHVVSFCVLYIL